VYCNKHNSIDESTCDTKITIWPNPSNNKISIGGTTVAELQIYDVQGQLIKTIYNTNELCVSDIPDGLYLLCISDHNGKTVTKRFIVIK
jgi:hypothetical protein